LPSDQHASTIAGEAFLSGFHSYRFKGLARRIFFAMMKSPKRSSIGTLRLTEKWGAHEKTFTFGSGDLEADLTINDSRAYAAFIFGGSRGLGRSYVNGLWDTSDIASLIRYLFRATQPLRRSLDKLANRFTKASNAWHRRGPSKVKDRENIHAHYDLSNEFFELMLDETMAYSCAIFKDEDTSLFDAQTEKFDRLCRKLRLSPGDHVLEIGTGWGGFAIHAAKNYGARVTTTTISENQRLRAIERVAEAGVSDLVTVLGDHYADVRGTYDALISVEMIEAVDWRKYNEFFSTCSRLLKDNGRMALQAITISEQSFERAKHQEDFIRDLIFPGGCLPSVTAIMNSVSHVTDLKATGLEDIGIHYAKTLVTWGNAVNEQFDRIKALGFDERFLRLWNMYLGYCEGAFIERHISVVQMTFEKPRAAAFLSYPVN
jgi:cyclopropane-fatty-acyl-phospholipid synthase